MDRWRWRCFSFQGDFFFGLRLYFPHFGLFALPLCAVSNMLYYERCYTMHCGEMNETDSIKFLYILGYVCVSVWRRAFPIPGLGKDMGRRKWSRLKKLPCWMAVGFFFGQLCQESSSTASVEWKHYVNMLLTKWGKLVFCLSLAWKEIICVILCVVRALDEVISSMHFPTKDEECFQISLLTFQK